MAEFPLPPRPIPPPPPPPATNNQPGEPPDTSRVEQLAHDRLPLEEFKDHLEDLEDWELTDLRQLLEEAVISIKSQLSEARRTAAMTGRYTDHDWYTSAERAQRAVGLKISAVQAERSYRKAQRAKEHDASEIAAWKRACREVLSKVQYEKVLHKVEELLGGE